MKIALDYDGTYTLAPDFWDNFIAAAIDAGHDIRIVTARTEKMMEDFPGEIEIPVINTSLEQKRVFCGKLGWMPDIWIDDQPEWIVE